MSENVRRALDGETDRESLTHEERRSYDLQIVAIHTTIDAIRSVPSPDLTAGVMDAIATAEVHGPRRLPASPLDLLRWFWSPRPLTVSWRPMYGMALLLIAVTAGFWPRTVTVVPPAENSTVAATPAVPAIYVQFRLDAPGASSVEIVGSFTDWGEGVQLLEASPGVWSTMVPLAPGVHDYTFVVDGEVWVTDPLSPEVDDGFGGSKNRLFLTGPLDNA